MRLFLVTWHGNFGSEYRAYLVAPNLDAALVTFHNFYPKKRAAKVEDIISKDSNAELLYDGCHRVDGGF